jgi:thioredoxin reductase (NADPH)
MNNVVIIGSGPAGYTAALYLGRANLNPLLLEGEMSGGLLTTTKIVENFPGFPDGIEGFDLTMNFRNAAIKYGTNILPVVAKNIEKRDDHYLVYTDEKTLATKTVIIATGSTPKRLYVPGYDKYWHKGITTCAVCDGALPCFRDVPVAVVGGGDSACEEALHMTHFASRVYLIHRRDKLRASPIMSERVESCSKIQPIWNSEILEIGGEDRIGNLLIRNNITNETSKLDVKGLFVAIGHNPNSDIFSLVEKDEDGYIKTERDCSTNMPGIYACGDVADKYYRQAITAAGTGCVAALEVQRYLEKNK